MFHCIVKSADFGGRENTRILRVPAKCSHYVKNKNVNI